MFDEDETALVADSAFSAWLIPLAAITFELELTRTSRSAQGTCESRMANPHSASTSFVDERGCDQLESELGGNRYALTHAG